MPGKISKPAIVAAALDVLDDAGLDGVTVRAVAARLGVQAPALYWHVRDKQALLDEMGTEIWRGVGAELTALPPELPWDKAMAAFASITRRALLAHRDGAKVFSGTYLTDPGILQSREAALRHMIEEGFALADIAKAYSLLLNFLIGFCIEEQAVTQTAAAGDDRYSLDRRAERMEASGHPLVVEIGQEVFGDQDTRFDELVGLIIDMTGRLHA